MATWIENQPVFFGTLTDACSCDADAGAQLVDNTDDTQFQFRLEPCQAAENLIVDTDLNDPTDWTFGGNWSMAYNQVCLTAAGDNTWRYLIGEDVFEDGKYYQVKVVVDSIADGYITIRIGSTTLGTIDTAGTYYFYGIATDELGEGRLLISNIDNQDVSVCISELAAYEILTDFKFAIYLASNNSYQTEISYANNPTYFEFVNDSVTITIDWSALGLSNNCYYICLLDPCTNYNGQNTPITITNPNFTGNANGWSLGASWVYNSNDVDWNGFIIPENNRLIQTIFPTYSYFATITIEVTAIVGTITVYFGATLMGSISTAGSHSFSGTPYGGYDLMLEPSVIGSGTITSITWNAPAFYEYHCDLQSNSFKLGDYSSNCTKLINACNNEDGLGFIFNGSGFSPRIRLESKLKQAKYANERSVYEDSLGTKKNVYYRRRKSKYLCIDLQPEYVHDFLSLALGFDNFYIDGVAYFVDDEEYSVDYSDASDNLGSVKILVSEKTQNVINVNCSDTENVCNLDGDFLLQADNLSGYITLTDGGRISING
jgi:hypothetical protein